MVLVTLDNDDCVNDGAFIYIGALAMAMAKASKSDDIMNAERKMFSRVNGAVQCGALRPFDPDNLVPLSKSDYGHGVVAIEELAVWGRSQLPPLDFKPSNSTATPAPEVASGDAAPDPERRLVLLRKLGGAAKYFRGEWSFTGIAALVASEKSEGRERISEKTIRADLKKAAQNERDAKSPGFGDWLGQR